MTDSGKFLPLWQKYRPAIISLMKLSPEGPQQYQFYKHEFDAAGDRKSLNYKFVLELNNGIPVTKITGVTVARDLLELLKSSNAAKELMKNSHFKIDLDKDFKLTINRLGPELPAKAVETEVAELVEAAPETESVFQAEAEPELLEEAGK
jgi:hypothetical protein